jgi:hypothetical protein
MLWVVRRCRPQRRRDRRRRPRRRPTRNPRRSRGTRRGPRRRSEARCRRSTTARLRRPRSSCGPVPFPSRASTIPAAGQCHPCRGPVPSLPRASAIPAAGQCHPCRGQCVRRVIAAGPQRGRCGRSVQRRCGQSRAARRRRRGCWMRRGCNSPRCIVQHACSVGGCNCGGAGAVTRALASCREARSGSRRPRAAARPRSARRAAELCGECRNERAAHARG